MRGSSRRHLIRSVGSGLVLALAAAACSSAPGGAGPTTGSGASAPAGLETTPSAPGGADAVDFCPRFTTAEIAAILGKPVGPGTGSGFICQWTATDGKSSASVYRSLPGLYDDAAAQPGFRTVTGIGEKAAIGPSLLGGTAAIALANDAYWLVRLDPSPSDDALLDFLRQLIARGQ